MRVAPIGLFFCGKGIAQREIDVLGAQAAALTHGHQLGYIPAALLVHVVSLMAKGETSIEHAVLDGLDATQRLFPHTEQLSYFTQLINKAVDLAKTNVEDVVAIQSLGEGWVAEETLVIALYCALKYHNDFARGVIAAVNHGGDSDSTGAVAGNVLGAHLGLQGIPQQFINNLELENLIEQVATYLFNGHLPPDKII